MALIKCVECGHKVSDKANACPNCGNPIVRDLCVCTECGANLSPTDSVCPQCGNPIHSAVNKNNQKSIRYMLFVIFALVLFGGAYIYYKHFKVSDDVVAYADSVVVAGTNVVSDNEQTQEEKDREEQARLKYLKREEQEEARKLATTRPDWIQGTWAYSAYGSTSKVIINGGNIIVSIDGSTMYNGSYTIEGERLVYNRHSGMSDYIILDRSSQRLKADESTYFSRVSYGSNGNYSSSSYDDNNVYSTDKGKTAYMEVLQLQKEVRALIDKSAAYRRIMRSEVYGSYNYQVASIQNVRILDAAIQKQEKALRIAKNKLHDESLIRELSGQLETLKKAKYSD